jgi:hypothetical protein
MTQPIHEQKNNLNGRHNLENVFFDGRIILKISLQEIGYEVADWIHPVNNVMNLMVPQKAGNFLTIRP